jgi:hypothetical protein
MVAFQISVVDGYHQPFQGVGEGLGRSEGVVFGHGCKCTKTPPMQSKGG